MDEVAISKDGSRIAFRQSSANDWWHCPKPTERGQWSTDLPDDKWVRLTPMTDRDRLAEEVEHMAELLNEVTSGMDWLRSRADDTNG
jgi:hypothetical protein